MTDRPGYSAAGSQMTAIWLEVFRLNGRLIAAGDALVADLGLTSARWQVLGAIALSERPQTVSVIARRMGLTRQAVQRIVNDMAAVDLIAMKDNPADKRAKLARLTDRGQEVYETAISRQVPWANETAAGIVPTRLTEALEVLQTIGQRLDPQVPSVRQPDTSGMREDAV
ncbi:MAG: MarR family winged helix-turn-helix transcriptional regulator [Pseudomonadota bacterium]